MLPALQRLSYAGKHLDDAQRTLEQYGIDYWHAKFPNWPITIRKRGSSRDPAGQYAGGNCCLAAPRYTLALPSRASWDACVNALQ